MTNPKLTRDQLVAALGSAGLFPDKELQPKRGRPRIEDSDKSFAATRPWEKLGMSERTWYRRRKEARAKL